MERLRSYLAQTIQRHLSAFIEDVRIEELGLLKGEIVLENISLRKDVLQSAFSRSPGVSTDYDISRGLIRELRIRIPWARVLSQTAPVLQVVLRTVEIVIVRVQPGKDAPHQAAAGQEPRAAPAVPETPAPSGGMASFVTNLLLNSTLRVENLTIQFEEDNMLASLYLCNLTLQSANPAQGWIPAFNEIEPPSDVWLFKALTLHDLTICLDERPRSVGESGASPSRRRHEQPLVDRASLWVQLALDVRDVFGFGAGEPGETLQPPVNPIFLDSPYALAAYAEQAEEGAPAVLPASFADLLPVLRHGVQGRWRVPNRRSSPLADPEQCWQLLASPVKPQQEQPHCAVILNVECSALRLSLSDRQLVLLRRLSSLAQRQGSPSSSAAPSKRPPHPVLRVLTLRLSKVSVSLLKSWGRARAFLALESKGLSLSSHSLACQSHQVTDAACALQSLHLRHHEEGGSEEPLTLVRWGLDPDEADVGSTTDEILLSNTAPALLTSLCEDPGGGAGGARLDGMAALDGQLPASAAWVARVCQGHVWSGKQKLGGGAALDVALGELKEVDFRSPDLLLELSNFLQAQSTTPRNAAPARGGEARPLRLQMRFPLLSLRGPGKANRPLLSVGGVYILLEGPPSAGTHTAVVECSRLWVGVLTDQHGAGASARRPVFESGPLQVSYQGQQQQTLKLSSSGGARFHMVPGLVRLLQATARLVSTSCAGAVARGLEDYKAAVRALPLATLPPVFLEASLEKVGMTLQRSGAGQRTEAKVDGLCLSCHERQHDGSHGEDPIATTISVVVKVEVPQPTPTRRTVVGLELTETLELKLDPIKVLAVRRCTELLGLGSSEQRANTAPPEQPSLLSLVVQVRRLTASFGLPWVQSEFATCRLVIQDGHLSCQSEVRGQISGRLIVGQVGAEGQRPSVETQEGRLSAVMARLAPFLLGSDLHNLRHTVLRADAAIAPAVLEHVPLLVAEKRAGLAWMDMDWCQEQGKGLTRLRVKAGGAELLWHFPTMHALLRLLAIGQKKSVIQGRASSEPTTGPVPAAECNRGSWPLVLELEPMRVTFLAGKLAEAPLALRFHVLGIGLENSSRCLPKLVDRIRIQFYAEVGERSRDLTKLDLNNRVQLTEPVELSIVPGRQTLLAFSPLCLLLGKLEMYTLWKVYGVYAGSIIRPPQLPGTSGQDEETANLAFATASHGALEAGAVIIDFPRAEVEIKDPTRLGLPPPLLFCIICEESRVVVNKLGGHLSIRAIQLLKEASTGLFLYEQRPPCAAAPPSEQLPELSMVWRKAKTGAVDLAIQLLPCTVRTDAAMVARLSDVGTFMNLKLPQLDGTFPHLIRPRVLRVTDTTKFMSSNVTLILDAPRGVIKVHADQLICSYRVGPGGVEKYFNAAGMRMAVADEQHVQWPVMEPANWFLSLEEGKGVQQSASANADRLELHMHPVGLACAVDAMRSIVGTVQKYHADARPAKPSPMQTSRTIVTRMRDMRVFFLDEVNPEMPRNVVVARCRPQASLRPLLMSWKADFPIRALSVLAPEVLYITMPGQKAGQVYDVALELVTQVEGLAEVATPATVLRVALRVAVGGSVEAVGRRRSRCDHSVTGTSWMLRLSFNDAMSFPLDEVWRSIQIALIKEVELETFVVAEDRVKISTHLSVPHAHLRLYPREVEPHTEALAHLEASDVRVMIKEKQRLMEYLCSAASVQADIVDTSSWFRIPMASAAGLRVTHSSRREHRPAKTPREGPPRAVQGDNNRVTNLAVTSHAVKLNVSKRILGTVEALKRDLCTSETDRSSGECLNYRIVNRTHHRLWFGQHLTSEMLSIDPLNDLTYSWRATFGSETSGAEAGRMLRFALNTSADPVGQPLAAARTPPPVEGDRPAVWSVPIGVEHETRRLVALRTTDGVWLDDVAFCGAGADPTAHRLVQLRVVIEKHGLETRIVLHGTLQIKINIPVPLQLRLSPAGDPSSRPCTISLRNTVDDRPPYALTSLLVPDSVSDVGIWLESRLMDADVDFAPAVLVKSPYAKTPSGSSVGEAAAEVERESSSDQGAVFCKASSADEPVHFICQIKKAHSDEAGGGQPAAASTAWLSLEIWPVAYLFCASTIPLSLRVASWSSLVHSAPSLVSLGEVAPSETTPTKDIPCAGDVGLARRAIREKLQRLSWKKMSSASSEGYEPSVTDGLDRWSVVPLEAGRLQGITQVDPLGGLVASLHAQGHHDRAQSVGVLLSSKTLADFSSYVGAPAVLSEAETCSLGGLSILGKREPNVTGPALVVHVVPGLHLLSECPFNFSLAALAPHPPNPPLEVSVSSPGRTGRGIGEDSNFGGFDQVGMQCVTAGGSIAGGPWSWGSSNGDPLRIAIGLTFARTCGEDSLREVRAADTWSTQAWSKPMGLDVLRDTKDGVLALVRIQDSLTGGGAVAGPAKEVDTVLPLWLTVEEDPLEGSKSVVHTLIVRPRIVLHSCVHVPGVCLSYMELPALGSCRLAQSAGPAESQAVILTRIISSPTRRNRKSFGLEGSVESHVKAQSTLERLWCRMRGRASGSEEDQEGREAASNASTKYKATIWLHAGGRPREALSASACGPLELEVDELMKTLHMQSSRFGVWGPTPGDATLLRLSCRFQRGSHHIIVDARSAVPLIMVNRSCYDLCVGKLRSGSDAAPNVTVSISSGSRIEWDPSETSVSIDSCADDSKRSQSNTTRDLADSDNTDLHVKSPQFGASAPFVFRLQCFLSQQRSTWSEAWEISDRPQSHVLKLSFAAEEGAPGAPGYEHVLTVSTLHVAGACCVYLEDGSTSTEKATSKIVEASLSDAHKEVSVDVGRLDVHLLDDSSQRLPEASASAQQVLVLPAFLAVRAGEVRAEFSVLQLQTPNPTSAGPGQPSPVHSYRTLALTVRELEVDNLQPAAEFPVALGFLQRGAGEEARPAIYLHFTEAFMDPRVLGPARSNSMVETITLALRPLRVSVESLVLQQLTAFYASLLTPATAAGPSTTLELHPTRGPSPTPLDQATGAPKLFFRSVRLAPVSMVLDTRIVLPGGSFLGLEGSPLFFQAITLDSINSSLPSFLRSVLDKYATDAILRSPAVLGSLQILGSPTVLLSRLMSGLRDLVVLPATGTLESGPYGAITGAGKGLLSLTRHVVGGTLSSLAAISSSVRRNLDTGAPEERRVLRSIVDVMTTPVRGALDVLWWSSERIISSTGVNKDTDGRRCLEQDQEAQAPRALCRLSLEAYYRRSCRLDFEQSFVGALGVCLERATNNARKECAVEMLPAVLVVAEGQLFCLTGQHGSETLYTSIHASHVRWWRQLRADTESAKPPAGLKTIVEIYDGKSDTQLKFWMNDESAQLLRNFLIADSATGVREGMALLL